MFRHHDVIDCGCIAGEVIHQDSLLSAAARKQPFAPYVLAAAAGSLLIYDLYQGESLL